MPDHLHSIWYAPGNCEKHPLCGAGLLAGGEEGWEAYSFLHASRAYCVALNAMAEEIAAL